MRIYIHFFKILISSVFIFSTTITTAMPLNESEEVFALMLNAGNLSGAKRIYSKANEISMAQRLIAAYIKADRLELTVEALQPMFLFDVKKEVVLAPELSTEKLAAAYREEERYASLIRIEHIFSQVRATPQIYHLSEENIGEILSNLYAQHYSLDDLHSLYNELIDRDESKDYHLYLALAKHLVSTYVAKNDFISAESVYALLYADGMNNASFNAPVTQVLVLGHLDAGNIDRAYEVFKIGIDGADSDIALRDFTESTLSLDLIMALIDSNETEKAYEIYRELQNGNYSDTYVHNYALISQQLIVAYLEKDDLERASEIYARMEGLGESKNVQRIREHMIQIIIDARL